ncbi:putative ribonuclease H-like domain-containing protein [Tanacetum coccineum]
MNQFCKMKGILRQFSIARTPQKNGVAERRNRTLIEATRTMLVDSKLPTTFWAEAVNTACYVQNRVLVVKPHNKTPYELFHGRTPTLSFMRQFGCPVTILNTIYHLGKFNSKADECFFVGYSLNSKAFRIFNSRTKIMEENLHIRFSENSPNVVGSGLDWLFDIDALTRIMNYEPIVAGTQSNGFAGTKTSDNAGQARKETEPIKNYILLPLWTADPPFSHDPKSSHDDGSKPSSDDRKKVDEDPRKDSECNDQEKEDNVNNTNNVNAASTNEVNTVGGKTSIELPFDPNMPALEDYSIFDVSRDDEDVGAEADINNLDTTIQVSPILTTRIHKDHPLDQVIRDLQSATQTRRMSNNLEEHGFVSTIQQRTNHKDLQNCLFACFLSQEEPKKVIHALKDPIWIEAMQEELLQFKLQEVLTLVDLPIGKRAIGTKWVFRNKKDERGIVIRNKARLVDYDEVFAPVARIEAIRLFLAYASFKDFVVYQMNVKSAFLYGKIEEEVYVCQPLGFEDPDFPDRVYKVEKALYRLHQAPKAWYETLSRYLLDNGFQRGIIDKTLFIKRLKCDILLQNKDDIFISQDKYVEEILKKFGFTDFKTASTPIETQKPLLKDENGEEVDVHMYRLMIGSLMYLTSSRPDIMFVVCACTRYQVNPKVSHLHVVKRVFRYLKGQPKLGLWYPKDSPFDLVAYTNSDYAGASLDRKSTTGGCQFLGCRLISWQCKKQTVVTNFTTEAEYVAASSCYGKVKTDNGELQLHALVDGKKIIINESTVKRDLQLENAEDEAVHKELGDNLVRAATTASSLEAEQDSGGGPRVLDLEKTKTIQANEIDSLKRRVKMLEKKDRSRTRKLKRLYKVGFSARVESSRDEENLGKDASKQERRINAIDADKDITLVNVQDDVEMFDMNTLIGDEVFTEQEVATKDVNLTVDEVTLAQALAALKSVKPKVKGVVIQEPSTTTTTTIYSQQPSQDKGKGIMVEELIKTVKKKDQIMLDEEITFKLQEEIDEEERIARDEEEKIDEANIAWDDIQAKVDADYQLA